MGHLFTRKTSHYTSTIYMDTRNTSHYTSTIYYGTFFSHVIQAIVLVQLLWGTSGKHQIKHDSIDIYAISMHVSSILMQESSKLRCISIKSSIFMSFGDGVLPNSTHI